MKVAPLQPTALLFQRVSIEPTEDEEGQVTNAQGFDFQEVNLVCDISYADLPPEEDDGHHGSMLVSADLKILNESGKAAPYKVEVMALATFRWLPKDAPDEKRRDVIVVNGTSILYGAIREMVLNITSRCVAGPLFLPSLNFLESRPSLQSEPASSK